MMKRLKHALLTPSLVAAILCACLAHIAQGEAVEIASLKELADYAARSGNTVTMKPGVYKLTDFLPLEAMAERRARKEFQFIRFSGSGNVFNLDGVTIEVDTALRTALRPPIHNNEFLISGSKNSIKGLEIRHIGDATSPAGAMISIAGNGNTLRDCTFHVRGSHPYGYGDLFGKGGPNIINHQKKSGVHITGSNNSLFGCRLFMRSFGHGYYIQQDAANIHFEDCYVEGEMRSTDDMLAETSGPAFKVGFRTIAKNRQGENRVTPGYMKSLAEDGFRTYAQNANITFKNCTAKHMRGGFELRTKGGVRLENCSAIGNERGFWVSTNAVILNSRGDAQYGPLLFAEGDNAMVELELLPAESKMTVHALATIYGSGNKVTIKAADKQNRTRPIPILIGFGTPGGGEGMSPIPERDARGLIFRNQTTMPISIGVKARDCEIITRGPVQENAGREITIKRD